MFYLILKYKIKSWNFLLGMFLALLSSLFGIYISVILGKFIDSLHGNVILWPWVIKFVLFLTGQTFFMGLSQFLLAKFGAGIFRNIQDKLFEKLINNKFEYIKQLSAGQWSSHLTTDILSVRSILSEQIPEMIIAIVKVLLIICFILILDWYILIPIFIFSLIIFSIVVQIGSKVERYADNGQKFIASLNELINNAILNIKVVKNFFQEQSFINRNKNILKNIFMNHIKAAKVLAIGVPIINSLLLTLIVSLIFLGSLQITSGFITLGKFLTISVLLLEIIPDIVTLMTAIAEIQEVNGQLKFIIDFAQIGDINEKNPILDFNINKIIFDKVSVKNQRYLFYPISFEAKLGDIILIKGPSGIGKSTLFDAIFKYNQFLIGDIYINNQNLKKFSNKMITNIFSYLTAENILISGKVSDNIFIDSEKYEKFVKQYHDDFVLKLKLSDEVIDLGSNFSSGQKRKINILRTLTDKRSIVLLDEPTVGLDELSKNRLYEQLKKMKNKIIIFTSHDVEDEQIATKIINLHDK